MLEGRWLEGSACWAAHGPAEVLTGSGAELQRLPAWLDRLSRRHPDGAAIGFLSYELARHFESLTLPVHASLPDVHFAYYPRVECFAVPCLVPPRVKNAAPVESPVSVDAYHRAVESIRSWIAAGDIYQANLTVPFTADLHGESSETIYRRIRAGGAAYGAFLKTPARTIISNSPERFFRVARNKILASPIKGTITRRGHSLPSAREALLASAKDRAENLMIVDLLRNDLGRICACGSIRARLWETEDLPQLVHLVSHVEGTLRAGVDLPEILRALFPCGSITGAPKIRAMEILAQIEGKPRGVSMGAVGIIRHATGRGGVRMDFSVAIRTITIEQGIASFNVGGGIVYDSTPDAEYAELLLKAQPLFAAVGGATEVETPRHARMRRPPVPVIPAHREQTASRGKC